MKIKIIYIVFSTVFQYTEAMIGHRNLSYGAMVLCDNLEGQSVYRKCCGFLIEAMERKLRNRGSLC